MWLTKLIFSQLLQGAVGRERYYRHVQRRLRYHEYGPRMCRRTVWLGLAAALAVWPQKYDGPLPPKPDLLYLKHAGNLIPTEALSAHRNDDSSLTIEGPSSTARTPLSEPILLMKSQFVVPSHLQLFHLDVKDGKRQIAVKSRPSVSW